MKQENLLNSIAQPLFKILLRSPLHKLADKNVALIIYTDRKSGESLSEAMNYLKEGKILHIISSRYRTWWRNLENGATVETILNGKKYSGWAIGSEDQHTVIKELRKIYSLDPQNMQLKNVGLIQNGTLNEKDLSAVAKDRVAIIITLS